MSGYTSFNKKVGTSLQEVRRAAGFKSAHSFADYAGLSKNTYTGYEQGRIALSLEMACNLAQFLNCTVDEIAGREIPERVYDDYNQKRLNDCYENMNDKGKETLVTVAQSLEKDIANRVTASDKKDTGNNAAAIA